MSASSPFTHPESADQTLKSEPQPPAISELAHLCAQEIRKTCSSDCCSHLLSQGCTEFFTSANGYDLGGKVPDEFKRDFMLVYLHMAMVEGSPAHMRQVLRYLPPQVLREILQGWFARINLVMSARFPIDLMSMFDLFNPFFVMPNAKTFSWTLFNGTTFVPVRTEHSAVQTVMRSEMLKVCVALPLKIDPRVVVAIAMVSTGLETVVSISHKIGLCPGSLDTLVKAIVHNKKVAQVYTFTDPAPPITQSSLWTRPSSEKHEPQTLAP
jgi:hypothetical protein